MAYPTHFVDIDYDVAFHRWPHLVKLVMRNLVSGKGKKTRADKARLAAADREPRELRWRLGWSLCNLPECNDFDAESISLHIQTMQSEIQYPCLVAEAGEWRSVVAIDQHFGVPTEILQEVSKSVTNSVNERNHFSQMSVEERQAYFRNQEKLQLKLKKKTRDLLARSLESSGMSDVLLQSEIDPRMLDSIEHTMTAMFSELIQAWRQNEDC